MAYWWITDSTGRGRGTISTDSAPAAEQIGAALGIEGKAEVLPYPARPYLNQINCPDFCLSPTTCKGRTSCPKAQSCTE